MSQSPKQKRRQVGALQKLASFLNIDLNMKISNVVKFLVVMVSLLVFAACQHVSSQKKSKARPATNPKTAPASDAYGPPTKLAELEDRAIEESSGLIASRTSPGCYWTHNDAGNEALIYAFDSNGRRRGVWRVSGATSEDWEDISAGPGPKPHTNYLYIGDIGDKSVSRSQITIYRIPEPVIPNSDPGATQQTAPAEVFRLTYPDGKHNAEALIVHPSSGRIYIVTKVESGNPGIYAIDAPAGGGNARLTRVGEIDASGLSSGLITGGAISPDGLRVALCNYDQGYEFILPDASAPFDSIWKQPFRSVDLGNRKHGESIAYRLDGKALMATSERLPTPLLQAVRR